MYKKNTSGCNHTLSMDLFRLARLLGLTKETNNRLLSCRFTCAKCKEPLRVLSWRKKRVRLIEMLLTAACCLCTLPIAVPLTNGADEINMPTWLVFAAFTGGMIVYLLIWGVFMQLISAAFIKAGVSVILVPITEAEALELDDYETIIHSKQRWKANFPIRLVVGILLIVFVGCTILMVILEGGL